MLHMKSKRPIIPDFTSYLFLVSFLFLLFVIRQWRQRELISVFRRWVEHNAGSLSPVNIVPMRTSSTFPGGSS